MTDTVTERDPWPVLAAILRTTPPDALFSARHWHYEAELAGLRPRQISAAQGTAVTAGYLMEVGEWVTIHGVPEFSPNVIAAAHEKAKGRHVHLYRRTDKRFPGQEAETIGQLTLVEVP